MELMAVSMSWLSAPSSLSRTQPPAHRSTSGSAPALSSARSTKAATSRSKLLSCCSRGLSWIVAIALDWRPLGKSSIFLLIRSPTTPLRSEGASASRCNMSHGRFNCRVVETRSFDFGPEGL